MTLSKIHHASRVSLACQATIIGTKPRMHDAILTISKSGASKLAVSAFSRAERAGLVKVLNAGLFIRAYRLGRWCFGDQGLVPTPSASCRFRWIKLGITFSALQ